MSNIEIIENSLNELKQDIEKSMLKVNKSVSEIKKEGQIEGINFALGIVMGVKFMESLK